MDPQQYPGECHIRVERYRNGDRLKWPQMRETDGPGDGPRERESLEQSVKSRLQSAFQLGNAETDWMAMATLTYRVAPSSYDEVREHWTRFKDRLRKQFPGAEWGWILEFQGRGAAHFHVFFGSGGELGNAIKSESWVKRKRKGKETQICSGPLADWIAETWIQIVGDIDERFLKFQRGGILELMRSPDAAGRYAAKEASKRVQKKAPWPVKQWWGMSNSVRPSFRSHHVITVAQFRAMFPDLPAVSRLWSHVENRD